LLKHLDLTIWIPDQTVPSFNFTYEWLSPAAVKLNLLLISKMDSLLNIELIFPLLNCIFIEFLLNYFCIFIASKLHQIDTGTAPHETLNTLNIVECFRLSP